MSWSEAWSSNLGNPLEGPRFPSKGCLKVDMDVGLGIDFDMVQPPNNKHGPNLSGGLRVFSIRGRE